MRKRRVLSWLLSVFIICSSVCGTVFASDISTLDDLGIDPWSELDALEDASSAGATGEAAEPAADTDAGIMPLSIETATGEWAAANTFSVLTSSSLSAVSWLDFTAGEYHSGQYLQQVSTTGPRSYYVSTDQTFYFRLSPELYEGSVQSLTFDNVEFRLRTEFFWNNLSAAAPDWTPRALLYVNGVEFESGSALTITVDGVGDNDASVFVNGSINWGGGEIDDIHVVFVMESGSYFNSSDRSYARYGTITGVVSGNFSTTGGNPDYTGILGGISSAISSVVSAISDVISGINELISNTTGIFDLIGTLADSLASWFGNLLTAIAQLPARIAELVKQAVYDLFVPSGEDMTDIKENYETLLSERLGFIWQAGAWVTDFATSIYGALQGGGEYTFEFPGISFPMNGETYVLVEPQTVSLDNAFMDVVQPVLCTIVSIICVVAFVNMSHDMVAAVVSGAAYWEFLKGGKG